MPTKEYLLGVLLCFFNSKRSIAESHRLLLKTYGDHMPVSIGFVALKAVIQIQKTRKFENEELEAILNEDPCQMQEELAESLNVDQSTISRLLKALVRIQKQGNWIQYELKPRDVDRQLCMFEMLLNRHKKILFVSQTECPFWNTLYFS